MFDRGCRGGHWPPANRRRRNADNGRPMAAPTVTDGQGGYPARTVREAGPYKNGANPVQIMAGIRRCQPNYNHPEGIPQHAEGIFHIASAIFHISEGNISLSRRENFTAAIGHHRPVPTRRKGHFLKQTFERYTIAQRYAPYDSYLHPSQRGGQTGRGQRNAKPSKRSPSAHMRFGRLRVAKKGKTL